MSSIENKNAAQACFVVSSLALAIMIAVAVLFILLSKAQAHDGCYKTEQEIRKVHGPVVRIKHIIKNGGRPCWYASPVRAGEAPGLSAHAATSFPSASASLRWEPAPYTPNFPAAFAWFPADAQPTELLIASLFRTRVNSYER